MAVKTRTVTTYECDRCHYTTETPSARGGMATVKVTWTAYAYDGTPGGATTEMWICGTCAEALRTFNSGQATGAVDAQGS